MLRMSLHRSVYVCFLRTMTAKLLRSGRLESVCDFVQPYYWVYHCNYPKFVPRCDNDSKQPNLWNPGMGDSCRWGRCIYRMQMHKNTSHRIMRIAHCNLVKCCEYFVWQHRPPPIRNLTHRSNMPRVSISNDD